MIMTTYNGVHPLMGTAVLVNYRSFSPFIEKWQRKIINARICWTPPYCIRQMNVRSVMSQSMGKNTLAQKQSFLNEITIQTFTSHPNDVKNFWLYVHVVFKCSHKFFCVKRWELKHLTWFHIIPLKMIAVLYERVVLNQNGVLTGVALLSFM